MMMAEGVILGHYICAAGIQVDPTKIQVIILLPTPCTQMEVFIFLGYGSYYLRFIKKISQISVPLYDLTRNVDFKWSNKCDTTFTGLKKLVSIAPVLHGPNWEMPFHIPTHTSNAEIGTVLGQEVDKKPYTIYYISKNLTTVELNYIVT